LEPRDPAVKPRDDGEVKPRDDGGEPRDDDLQPLLSKITSTRNLAGLLSGIYCAKDLPQALALRSRLQANESLITPEGLWIGPNWLRVALGFDEKAGMIQRQEEIDCLADDITEQEDLVSGYESQLEQA